MVIEIPLVKDSVFREAFLPDLTNELKFPFRTEGEAALGELHTFLQRLICSGREERVEMVTHYDEIVNLHPAFRDILSHDFD